MTALENILLQVETLFNTGNQSRPSLANQHQAHSAKKGIMIHGVNLLILIYLSGQLFASPCGL